MTSGRAQLWLHVTVFIWGFTAILGKLISLNAMALVWYRQGLAAVMLALWLLVRRRPMRLPWRDARTLIGVGALVCLHWVCFYATIKLAGVAVAVVCLSACGFFVSLVEPLVFSRRFRWREAALGLLVIGGVVLLTGGAANAEPLGIAIGIASALFSAVFSTLNGRLVQRFEVGSMALWELGAATGWLTVGLLVVPSQFVAPALVSSEDWLWLALLSGVCTVAPWLVSLRVMRSLSPFTAALALNLEPVYSLLLAYLLFPHTERLTAPFYAGTAVLVAVVAGHAVTRATPPLASA